jgi:hypothetical protein
MGLALRPCASCARWTGKVFWLKANRALAWALVLSPPVQIVLGTPFLRGLAFDLALLAAHAVASLLLFGLPRTQGRSRWLLFVGIEPQGLSPRNRFLMTGWSIALALAYAPAFLFIPLAALVLGPAWLLSWLLLPMRTISHVFQAAQYAGRRWGLRHPDAVADAGFAAAFVFVAGNLANGARALFF